jgi:hypothetical protein
MEFRDEYFWVSNGKISATAPGGKWQQIVNIKRNAKRGKGEKKQARTGSKHIDGY